MPEDIIGDILKFDPGQTAPEVKQGDIVDDILKFDPSPSISEGDIKQPSVMNPASQGQENPDLTWKQTALDAVQNIPESAWEYGKGIAKSLAHPIETAKGLRDIIIGGLRKTAIPGTEAYKDIQESKPEFGHTEVIFDAFIQLQKDRYGSIDKFKKTLAEDPVGVLADAAAILMPMGSAGAKAGKIMEPANLARRVAAAPLRLISEKVPINWYQSAVKFGTTLSGKERLAVTKTALSAENQIMPTAKGMEKLRGMIDKFNERVNFEIGKSAKTGSKVNVDELFKGLEPLKDQFKKASDQPLVWDAAFKGIKKQWEEALKISPVRSPEEVQKIKTSIYRELEGFYEKQKATPAKTELRKAIARNARATLEIIIPEIKQLNKKEGALIDLWDAVESKANRISNRDLIGIGLPIKMGAGSGIGYMFAGEKGAAIGTVLGFSLGIFDTPQVKSKMALVLSKLKEKGITVKPTTAAIKLGLYQADKATSEKE